MYVSAIITNYQSFKKVFLSFLDFNLDRFLSENNMDSITSITDGVVTHLMETTGLDTYLSDEGCGNFTITGIF